MLLSCLLVKHSSKIAPWSTNKSCETVCRMVDKNNFWFKQGSRSQETTSKGNGMYPLSFGVGCSSPDHLIKAYKFYAVVMLK